MNKQENRDLLINPVDMKRANVIVRFMEWCIVGVLMILFAISCLSCKVTSKSPAYYYEQGKIENAKTNHSEAVKLLTRAIKLHPHYLEAYLERANANMKMDSLESAIRDYDSILALKDLTVQEMGEYTFLKSRAYYMWNGLDSTYCKLLNQACDGYGHNKSCDLRRNFCK